MKQGKTLIELAQHLEALRGKKVDLVSDTKLMHYTADCKLIIDAEHVFAPTSHCDSQIADRLNIPAKYFRMMQEKAPALLAANINHWFEHSEDRRMIRGIDGKARAFLSDRYHRIDNEHVLETLLPVLMETGGIEVKSCEVTENRLYIKATSTNVRMPVISKRGVGDIVEAGVLITNSETGQGSLSIKPFLNFLICTNGMVRDKLNFMKYHVGRKIDESEMFLSDATKSLEDQAVLAKIRDVMKACMNMDLLSKEVEIMNAAAKQEITGDVPKAVQLLGETMMLTQPEQSGILRNLIISGDLSRYSLMNAVTAFAETVASYDRATEIETIGGRVLDLNPRDWNRIAEARA